MTVPNHDLPPDAFRDEPWTDVLPWLASYAPGEAHRLLVVFPAPDWWITDSPALTSATGSLGDACTALAATLVADHLTLNFGRAFPAVPDGLPTGALPVSTRARTALQRLDVSSVGELKPHSVRDLFDVRGTGAGTVHEIVEALIGASVLRRPARLLDDAAPTQPSGLGASRPAPFVHSQLLEDLVQLAAWRHLRGNADKPLIAVTTEDGEPEQIQELVARLTAMSAEDLLPAAGAPDPIAELNALLFTLDERQRIVLRERFLAPSPRTLADLADELNVSRERVRQIENKIKVAFAASTDFGSAVGNLLASMRVEIQPVAAIERLISKHPGLSRTVPELDVPLWLVLDRLDDYFEVADGWAAAPDVASARERTRELLEDLENEYGVVEFAALLAVAEMPPEELRAWLRFCGHEQSNGHILTRTRTLSDHAAGVLAAAGEPLEFEEILRRVGKDRTVRSLANALSTDKRFVRTDRSEWALADWGVEEYTNIRTLIARAIDANGGQVVMGELLESITSRFAVSPASVQYYASSGDFEVRENIVRRSTHRRPPRKRPEDTRRLFRHGDAWRYRMTVTKDQLRGSGFTVPAGFAALLGCAPGEAVELASDLGAQPVRWTRAQPVCGTIRRFLDQLAIAEGQTIFLEVGPGRSFSVHRAVEALLEAPVLNQALCLAGLSEVETVDAQPALAEAVGLPADANRRLILRALWTRGDSDIAELLEQAWGWSSRESIVEFDARLANGDSSHS